MANELLRAVSNQEPTFDASAGFDHCGRP